VQINKSNIRHADQAHRKKSSRRRPENFVEWEHHSGAHGVYQRFSARFTVIQSPPRSMNFPVSNFVLETAPKISANSLHDNEFGHKAEKP
jgi:hypothetical protein